MDSDQSKDIPSGTKPPVYCSIAGSIPSYRISFPNYRDTPNFPLSHNFFLAVCKYEVDLLDQEPTFFPSFQCSLSFTDKKERFSLTLGDIIARNSVGTVFEVSEILDAGAVYEDVVIQNVGLLRVPTSLVVPECNGAPCPPARHGIITTAMEIEWWDPIADHCGGNVVAHFPPNHSVPITHVWNFYDGCVDLVSQLALRIVLVL